MIADVRLALRKVADAIEERGWCRFERQDGQGRLCLLGAVSLICTGGVNGFVGVAPTEWFLLNEIRDNAKRLFPERYKKLSANGVPLSVSEVNDLLLESQGEALQVLRGS